MERKTTECIGTYINRLVNKQILSLGVQMSGKFTFLTHVIKVYLNSFVHKLFE
jgi:hypothetical protein